MFTFVPSVRTAKTSRIQDLPLDISFTKDWFSRISTDSIDFFPERPRTAYRRGTSPYGLGGGYRKPSSCTSLPFSPMTLKKRKSLRGLSLSVKVLLFIVSIPIYGENMADPFEVYDECHIYLPALWAKGMFPKRLLLTSFKRKSAYY